MRHVVRIVIFLSMFASTGICAEENDASILEKEYTILEELLDEGAYNANLFLRLAELSNDQAKSLAYLRQAHYLAPGIVDMHRITTLRSLLKASTSIDRTHDQVWWHSLLLAQYIPHYWIDYLLIVSSLCGILLISVSLYLKSNVWKYYGTLLFTLLVVLFFQRFLLIQDGSSSVRLIGSLEDLSTREGIVLQKLDAYAAPSTSSHQTMLLSPGAEVLLVKETPEKGWTLVREMGGRKGWVKDTNDIFILRK